MTILKRFILMFQFLTSIPIPIKLDVKEEDFGKGLVFAPVVGLFIGGVLSGIYLLLGDIFPLYVKAILVIIAYIAITGGLHLDGLGDTFDGLFSNRSKERMLEIMRDSRVGTNAVLAIVSVFVLNTALVAGFERSDALKALLFMPVAGRIGSLISAGVSRYARSGEGLGKSFIDFCGYREIAAGTLLYAIIAVFALGYSWLPLCGIPIITSLLTVFYFSRKIGGMTGDVLGAVCELNQTFLLIGVYLLNSFK